MAINLADFLALCRDREQVDEPIHTKPFSSFSMLPTFAQMKVTSSVADNFAMAR